MVPLPRSETGRCVSARLVASRDTRLQQAHCQCELQLTCPQASFRKSFQRLQSMPPHSKLSLFNNPSRLRGLSLPTPSSRGRTIHHAPRSPRPLLHPPLILTRRASSRSPQFIYRCRRQSRTQRGKAYVQMLRAQRLPYGPPRPHRQERLRRRLEADPGRRQKGSPHDIQPFAQRRLQAPRPTRSGHLRHQH